MAKKTARPIQDHSPSKFDWDKERIIIWNSKRLKNEDWNFEPHQHELQGVDGRVAFAYEIARNMSQRVEMAKTLSQLDSKARNEAEHWAMMGRVCRDENDPDPIKHFPFGPWFEPEFPDTPWFLIPQKRRKEIVEAQPEIRYGEPVIHAELSRVLYDYYNSKRVVGWEDDLGNGNYLCAFVINRTFSDSEIKKALQKEWLDHHPEEKMDGKKRPVRQHWFPLLRALGMLRILDCHKANRTKAEIFLQNEFSRKPNRSFDTSSAAWSKAKILVNRYLNEYRFCM